MTQLSNRELILRLQAGNLDALGSLYDRHSQMVYRTALGITGDAESAADLLQDVFLRVHRFADRIDHERPIEPWLYRVTTNLACTWAKRRKWMRPIEDFAEWLIGDNKNSPSRMAEQSETRGQIEEAIASLPLPQRTVIVMYYVNGLSLQEISEIIDIPVGTVKSRLHYGRQALKSTIELPGVAVLSEVRYEFT